MSIKTIGAAVIGAAAIGLSVGSVQSVEAASVDFTNQGTFQTPSFSQNGLTVTGSNTLQFSSGSGSFVPGLGVVGGILDEIADVGESVFFSFAPGGASSISLLGQPVFASAGPGGSPPPFGVEGFDVGGTSLGTASIPLDFSLSPYNIDISGLFGNTILSGFRFSTVGGNGANGTSFSSINFTPATPIPTPALLPAVIGMGIAAWKKRKNGQSETVAETAEV